MKLKKIIKFFLRLFGLEIFNNSKIDKEFIDNFEILKKKQSKIVLFINRLLKMLNSNHILISSNPESAEKMQPYIYSENPSKKQVNLNSFKVSPVVVSGFGATGSSSVIHFLREQYGFVDPKPKGNTFEFRLIKDPGGLMDLRRALKKNSYWNNYSYIHDFINQTKVNSRLSKSNFLTRFLWPSELKYQQGFALDKLTNNNFSDLTEKFIFELVDVKHKFNWWNHYRNLNFYQELIQHVQNKFTKSENNSFLVKIKDLDEEEMNNNFANYLDQIFKFIVEVYLKKYHWFDTKTLSLNKFHLLLDQGVLPEEIDESIKILPEGTKIIVVSRDPRDVYISSMSQNSLTRNFPSDVKEFCKIYKTQYQHFNNQKSQNILHLKFENWIFENKKEIQRIEDFLKTKLNSNKKFEGKFFSIEWSKSRIGKWKNYQDKSKIEYIRNSFSEEIFYD